MALRADTFLLAPPNPSDSVDLVPVGDPPPELEVELAALKTHLRFLQFPLSGSKPASTSETRPPVTCPLRMLCNHALVLSAHVSTINS